MIEASIGHHLIIIRAPAAQHNIMQAPHKDAMVI